MTPQEEKELLLRVVTKLAAKQIVHGGFIPFGATLGSQRDVQLLMPKSMKKNVTPDELNGYWVRELRHAATSGDCKTVCWCADVRVKADGDLLAPAVLVHVEHLDAYSEDVLYPYRKDGGSELVFGEGTTEATDFQIFTPSHRENC